MIGWLRTRRAQFLAAAIAATVAGLLILRSAFVPMPIMLGTDGMALWSSFLPLLWAAAMAECFSSKRQAAEIRPAPRLRLLDAALFLSAATAGAVVFGLFAMEPEAPAGAVAHVLIMSGVSCALALRRGAGAAVLASSSLLVLTMFYGIDAPAGPYVRVLQPDGDQTWAVIVGVACCLVSCGLILTDSKSSTLATFARVSD